MKHLKLDIQEASWLNEGQKYKLCKAFDAVRVKDAQQQGLDMLNLDPDKIYHYQQSMIGILRALSVKGVNDVLGSDRVIEIGEYVEDLLACFQAWDSDDMRTLIEIYRIYQYGDNRDEKIDSLLRTM